MKMGIDYKKILKQLIEERPHDIDKIEKVVKDSRNCFREISLDIIINSKVWDASEKAKLIAIFGYDVTDATLDYITELNQKDKMNAFRHTIVYNNITGFEALILSLKTIYDKKNNRIFDTIKGEDLYRRILLDINELGQKESSLEYMKIVLSILREKDLIRFIEPRYRTHCLEAVHDESIMKSIIRCGDLELIKEYIKYVKDINLYISDAVETGNKKIVEYFLSLGADINYYPKDGIIGVLIPLKTAIKNNDAEMVEFLLENGADANLQVKEDNFEEKLKNHECKIITGYNTMMINYDDKDGVENLKYLRESTPLEFASRLAKNFRTSLTDGHFLIDFKGQTCLINQRLDIDVRNLSEKVQRRAQIGELLFDKCDKEKVNFTDLIGLSFATRDVERFKKYTNYIIENEKSIDIDYIFNIYFYLQIDLLEKMTTPFLNFLSKLEEKKLVEEDIIIKFYNQYLERKDQRSLFYMNNFNRTVLNKIDQEKRINFRLVPDCRDLSSLTELLDLGFDINQTDVFGRNILIRLLHCRWDTFTKQEKELYYYLVDKIDLAKKDNAGYDALHYALISFNTKDEYAYGNIDLVKPITEFEEIVADFINRMKPENLNKDDITHILEERITGLKYWGNRIDYEFVYQHHRDLFLALTKQGYTISEKLFNHILSKLYSDEKYMQERFKYCISRKDTLNFVFQKLDRNTDIQHLNIKELFEKIRSNLNKELPFEDYKKLLTDLEKNIKALKDFYKESVSKKFDPEKYMRYAREMFETTYKDLDIYLLRMIIFGLKTYGSNKFSEILAECPDFDINTYLYGENVGLNYWDYIASVCEVIGEDDNLEPIYNPEKFEGKCVDCCDEMIIFYGGLMQYAILTDDLDLVKSLEEKGASLEFIMDDQNFTWDYVSSTKMLKYMESKLGKKEYANMSNEEKAYYRELLKNE